MWRIPKFYIAALMIKRECFSRAMMLIMSVVLPAIGGLANGQATVDGSGGVDMGNVGYISGLQPLPYADGTTWDWETSPDLQSFVIPAGQLTGLAPDGSVVPYDDLIPLKVPKLSVVTGSPGAAPVGIGTFIDGKGLETNELVVNGQTRHRGQVIIEQPQGDISMGIYQ
jgi:hypothetical protein